MYQKKHKNEERCYNIRDALNHGISAYNEETKAYKDQDIKTNEEFERMSEIRKTYDDAYEKFTTGDFEKAKEIFESNAENDQPSAKFVEKCQKMISNPPENWDGILRATEK